MTKIKLRAFEISNPKLSASVSDLTQKLTTKLASSKETSERRMTINSGEANPEEDLISHHENSFDMQFCTVLRIAPGDNVPHVNDKLFKLPTFSIADLDSDKIGGSAIYKSHYYFGVSDNFLVTNLAGNRNIICLQTYINWYLGELYDINPCIAADVVNDLANVKAVTVVDPVSQEKYNKLANPSSLTEKSIHPIADFAMPYIRKIISDSSQLSDVQLANLVSAKLIVEINKPKKNDPEEVKKAYAALLKPMADLDHVVVQTRNSRRFKKGSDIVVVKEVEIDQTEEGNLNENSILQSMASFINELKNEENNLH